MKLTPSAGCGVSFKHSAKKAYTGIFLISGINMSTYVVGDIQGCFEPFQHLLAQVRFNPDKDCLWSTGDLVNRGPQNLETLRWFYTRRDNVNIVLGNHDLHLMAVSAGVRKPSSKDNIHDILEAPDRELLIEWLHHQPLVYHEQDVTLVHAGIPPIWNIEAALSCASEVEIILQSERAIAFFQAMYGNEPSGWEDTLSGMTRLRVITNYLTRMRYCTLDGELDLISKGPEPIPDILGTQKVAPWFSHANRLTKDDTIIFGHWASLEGDTNDPNVIGLDTGCVWGRTLTFYELETGRRISCDCVAS